jgi:hypothetical protein
MKSLSLHGREQMGILFWAGLLAILIICVILICVVMR